MTDRELMQQALDALNSCCTQQTKMWFDNLLVYDAITALRERLAQSEQEPVAWANSNDLQNFDMRVRTNGGPLHTVPLYTTPPQRKPLTFEEILSIAEESRKHVYPSIAFARAIEAAHGIKP